MSSDEEFMRKTLDLAKKGRGVVSPNPMVGALLVKNGKIISKGYHKEYGGAHAEKIAIEKAGEEAEGATLFVNLEPCHIHKKTPPCTNVIVKNGIERVVIGMEDVNPDICGEGIGDLKEAGIEVVKGVLEDEAKKLNRGFIKYMEESKPWVTLKLALTTDGYIGDSTGKSQWITSEDSLEYVREQRLKHDSIMVGLGTVMKDDPSLLPDDMGGFIPSRIVIDERLIIPYKSQIVNDDYTDRTVILTAEKEKQKRRNEFEKRKVSILTADKLDIGWVDIENGLKTLADHGITSVYCEGGGRLAGSLMEGGFVDEIQVFIAPKILGDGIKSFSGIKKSLDEAIQLEWDEIREYDKDILLKGHLD